MSVANRYATALFAVAQEQKLIEQVGAELHSFVGNLEISQQLADLFNHPQVQTDVKNNVIRQLFGNHMSKLVLDFLALLLTNRRAAALRLVIEEYDELLRQAQSTVRVEAIVAIAMDDQQKNNLMATLQAKLGQRIELAETIDPAILGGVVLRIGDQQIDGSLKTRLIDLQRVVALPVG